MFQHSNKRRLLASEVPSPSVHKRQRVHILHNDVVTSSQCIEAASQWCSSKKDIEYLGTPSPIHLHPHRDNDSCSTDDTAAFHTRCNGRDMTQAPAQANELPWWLRPSSHSMDSSIDSCIAASSSQVCYYCSTRPAHHSTSCGRCDRMLCDICVRSCQSCQEVWCPCCSIVDYDTPIERTLCFECYDDCSRHDIHIHTRHVKPDNDHVMLAWD